MNSIPAFDFQIPKGDKIEFEFGRIESMPGILKAERFPHRHNFYEILWITEGDGVQHMDFRKYEIKAPIIFFLSSEQVHYWEIRKSIKGYAFLFTSDFFTRDARHQPLLEFPFFHAAVHAPVLPMQGKEFVNDMNSLAVSIEHEYKSSNDRREIIIRSYLSILLAKLANEFASRTGLLTKSKGDAFVRALKLKIDQHYHVKKSPADYAELLNVTPKYLTQLVKKQTGKTTTDLISDRLLLEAKRLLIYSDRTVSEVGFELGFESASYFGRFFRKLARTSPGDFRDKNSIAGAFEYSTRNNN